MPTTVSEAKQMGSRTTETWSGGILVSKTSTPVQSVGTSLVISKPAQRKKPPLPLAATPYEYSRVEKRYPRGFAIRYNKSSGTKANVYVGQLNGSQGVAHGDMRGPGLWHDAIKPGGDIVSMAITGALNQLLTQEVDGMRRDGNIDLGVAWRERNELGRMYSDVGTRFVKSRDAIRELNFKKFSEIWDKKMSSQEARDKFRRSIGGKLSKAALRAPGAFAKGWLALKLAYMPLWQDLHAAAESLAYGKLKHDWDINVRKRVKRVQKREDFISPYGSSYTGPKTKFWQQLTTSATVGLVAHVDNEMDHRLAQLGLNNPASMLYESFPLTFVADYFTDLGSYLKSLGAPFGMQFRTGYLTEYVEWMATCEDDGSDTAASWYGQARNCKWERSVYTNWPFPFAPLAIKPGGLNVGQTTTLASLVYATFMSRMRRYGDWTQRTSFHNYTD